MIPPTRQNRRRHTWNSHRWKRPSSRARVDFPLLFSLILSYYRLVFEQQRPIKLRHKIRTMHAIQSNSFPPHHLHHLHPFTLIFLSIALSDNTYRNQAAATRQRTLILSYFGLFSMCFHLYYSIPITGTLRSPLRYKTYNMLLLISSAHASVFNATLLLFEGSRI